MESHPYLVSLHEDVILGCVDDADVTIRLRALDLVVGMVNPENLMTIVNRLMVQLRNSPIASPTNDPLNNRRNSSGVVPMADSDDEEAEQSIKPAEQKSNQTAPLPDEYRASIIRRILEMCSRNTYSNISDFDWYIDVLVQLLRHVPTLVEAEDDLFGHGNQNEQGEMQKDDVAQNIGSELRNVAVRVKSSRREVTRAAELLLAVERRDQMLPSPGSLPVLEAVVWIVGEYAIYLADPRRTLASIVHSSTNTLPNRILAAYIQAAGKVFSLIAGNEQQSWNKERQTQVSLLLATIIDFLDPLTIHPNLEVQERAVEFLELARLVNEAIAVHDVGTDYGNFTDPPLLLTQAMPSLFSGIELNPVARDAQKKVPLPEELDLEKPINNNLQSLLLVPDLDIVVDEDDDFIEYYRSRPEPYAVKPAAARLEAPEVEYSYQQGNSEYLDPDLVALRRAERRERHKDDPFYIPSVENSGTSTPLNNRLRSSNGEDLDIDSIPIMELKLDSSELLQPIPRKAASQPKARKHIDILADESLGDDIPVNALNAGTAPSRTTRSLLQVDSSGLGLLSLDGEVRQSRLDIERREAEDAEMAKAMKEVERLRLEMQRASEKVEVKNGPADGVVVKRKKKKKLADEGDAANGQEEPVKAKKKKVSKGTPTVDAPEPEPEPASALAEAVPRNKKSKRRQVALDGVNTGALV